MDRSNFVCSIDLFVCGRNCEANPHTCPAKMNKEIRQGYNTLVYGGKGKPGKLVPTRDLEEKNNDQDKE